MNYILILSFLISLILTYTFLPMVKVMLTSSNVLCENFRLEKIPTAMGLVFIFAQTITIGILEMFYDFNNSFNSVYLLGFTFIGLIGLLDDLIGDKEVKGLKGHIKAFFHGKLTTGAIKAFLGLFISFVISSYISTDIINFIINGLVIGLFTNSINLFDLRPGRAAKTFILISMLLMFFSSKSYVNHIIYSIYGLIIPYIILDLRAEVMMGDTGANVLGFTLGVYSAGNFEMPTRIIILFVLILIHFLAEKFSFSKIIENNRILKYLDNIGR